MDRQHEEVAPRAVSVSTAARMLGVGRATGYRMTTDGTLRVVRLRGVLRVPLSVIDEILAGDRPMAAR